MSTTTIILYIVTGLLLIISLIKSRKKTKIALKKALKSFENILPQFLGVIVLVGIMMAVFDTAFVSKMIGDESGWLGIGLSAVIGSITLIPGFVAFPTAKLLLDNGAGYMQIAAFISSLMMVGIVTMPIEVKYFGKKMTIWRNVMAFIFSLLVALIIGKVMGI